MSLAGKWHSFRYDRIPPGRTMESWRVEWKDRTNPRREAKILTQMVHYAAELRVLFQHFEPQRVLEIGCGDGALFSELGFQKVQYRGVDFSPSMLEVFKSRFPDADLVESDGSCYNDKRSYDLIISNEVVQYFDRQMLERHLAGAREMLAPGGRLIIASILWKQRRWRYCSGEYDTDLPMTQSVMKHLRVLSRMKVLGTWYATSQIKAVGRRQGFDVEIFGSMVCLYRFHAVLQCR